MEYFCAVFVGFAAGFIVKWMITPAPPTCLHDWQVVTDKEFPSLAQEAKERGFTSWPSHAGEYMKFLSKVYVAVLRCTKCGALQSYRMETKAD